MLGSITSLSENLSENKLAMPELFLPLSLGNSPEFFNKPLTYDQKTLELALMEVAILFFQICMSSEWSHTKAENGRLLAVWGEQYLIHVFQGFENRLPIGLLEIIIIINYS